MLSVLPELKMMLTTQDAVTLVSFKYYKFSRYAALEFDNSNLYIFVTCLLKI